MATLRSRDCPIAVSHGSSPCQFPMSVPHGSPDTSHQCVRGPVVSWIWRATHRNVRCGMGKNLRPKAEPPGRPSRVDGGGALINSARVVTPQALWAQDGRRGLPGRVYTMPDWLEIITRLFAAALV